MNPKKEREPVMKTFALLCFIMVAAVPLEAQEMQGVVNSNYAGLNGMVLNPSFIADSKLYLDINILSTDAFFQTDMNKNAYGSFRLSGPSVMLNKGRHAFAFSEAVRSAVSFRKINQKNNPASNNEFEKINVAGLAWGEVDFTYAYLFRRIEKSVWAGGLTFKMLGGGGGAFYVSNANNYSFSSSMADNLNNIGISGGGGMGAGTGFGVDMGVTYSKKSKPVTLLTFKKLCQQKFTDYDYRLGVSVVDLGFIRFSDKVNTSHFNQSISNSVPYFIDTSQYTYATDTNLYNYASSISQEHYSMGLPTAVCLQFDWHYYKNWYFNGTFVQGLNFTNSTVRRPTMLAVTPRYEKRWFEVNLPVSVSDMKYFRLGLSLRLWNFIIGSDNLFGSLGAGMNKSFDLYVSLRMNFVKGKCGRKKGSSMFDPFRQLAS